MWFEELPVNFDCSWSGLRFICRIGSVVDVVAVYKVVMSPCSNLLILKLLKGLNPLTLRIKIGSFEVAHWIEVRKVAEFIHDEFEKRPFDFCVIWWNFEIFIYLLILIEYFNWSSALLCCFKLLIDWWRNRWVELFWYKIFLCGNEVFGCFEDCCLLNMLINVLIVSALSKIC